MDEGGSKKDFQKTSDEGDPFSIIQRFISDVGNVFSTSWLRCTIQTDDGVDRFVLGSRRYLLLNFRLLLVCLYITYELLK
jgi:hypothetical protein